MDEELESSDNDTDDNVYDGVSNNRIPKQENIYV